MKIRGPYNVDCDCHGCAAGRKEIIEICIVYGKWRFIGFVTFPRTIWKLSDWVSHGKWK